jgi:hypothetical protein
MIMGSVKDALKIAEEAVNLAEGDDYHTMICLTTLADAKHHAADFDGAEADFLEAERISNRIFSQNGWRYLRSFQGYRYCEYLLTRGRVSDVKKRVESTMEWDKEGGYPPPPMLDPVHALQTEGAVLPLALDHLVLVRALLVEAKGNEELLREAEKHLNEAISGIQESATQHIKPKGLLVKAEWLCARNKTEEAEKLLSECLSICIRSKMKLYEADCRLGLARLHLKEGATNQGMDELKHLRDMSDKLGYGLLLRRYQSGQ